VKSNTRGTGLIHGSDDDAADPCSNGSSSSLAMWPRSVHGRQWQCSVDGLEGEREDNECGNVRLLTLEISLAASSSVAMALAWCAHHIHPSPRLPVCHSAPRGCSWLLQFCRPPSLRLEFHDDGFVGPVNLGVSPPSQYSPSFFIQHATF
jgi:hypothetical protein